MNRREMVADLGARAALMAVVYAVFAAQLPNYYAPNGIAALLDGAVLTGIVAAGIGVSMLAGEFDLSVGSLAAVAGVITIKLIGFGVLPSILVATAIAAVFGAVQGWIIALVGINSLVFTIGTLIALRGFALVLAHENTVSVPIELLGNTDVVSQRIGVFSPMSLTMLAAFVLIGAFLGFTRWGREIYAVGGGRAEARAAGVPVLRPIVIAFTLSATSAGLAGALLSIRSGSATPLGFDTVLLAAATACLMGGVALEGGRGSMLGIAFGVFTLRFLITGVASLGAPFWLQNLATGALLILVILAQLSGVLLRARGMRLRAVGAVRQG